MKEQTNLRPEAKFLRHLCMTYTSARHGM